MSIIEKAAQRLEQLRKAGVETPAPSADRNADFHIVDHPGPEHGGTPERAVSRHPTEHADTAPATEPSSPSTVSLRSRDNGARVDGGSRNDASHRHDAASHADSIRRSKFVEIDLVGLAAAGYITPEAHRSQIADEFRVLKRPIIKNAQGAGSSVERGNCVMVTSALPSEGKSFVALNLAMSIASEIDSTVLLIDADVANPNLMKRMHLPAARGLLDLLTSETSDPAEVLLRTNVEKLSLLPAGSAHRRATEMLASTSMADLVEQMSTRYPDRILVFDSPPLLATTEARVLASHMGQIVMVVEADVTTQGAVQKALETVETCPVVMMVLNKAQRTDVGGYYGYGFYGYGNRT